MKRNKFRAPVVAASPLCDLAVPLATARLREIERARLPRLRLAQNFLRFAVQLVGVREHRDGERPEVLFRRARWQRRQIPIQVHGGQLLADESQIPKLSRTCALHGQLGTVGVKMSQ